MLAPVHTLVKRDAAIAPVHQLYNYLQCPLPEKLAEDRHMSTNNHLDSSDVFFTLTDFERLDKCLTLLICYIIYIVKEKY